jgi:hypothetical protein
MLRPIDPTEQALVQRIQCKEVVGRPELPVVLGRDSPGTLVREQSSPPCGISWIGPILSGERTTGGLWRFRISGVTFRFLSSRSGSGEVFQVRIDWRETSS